MPEEDHNLSTDREVVFEMKKTGANCCTSNRADQHLVHLVQEVALMATPAGLTCMKCSSPISSGRDSYSAPAGKNKGGQQH